MLTAARKIRIVSHATGFPIVDVRLDSEVWIGRMTYTKHGRTSVRHPMESGEQGELIAHTLSTGILHEVAKDAANFKWRFRSEEPIRIMLAPDQKTPDGTHLKVMFPIVVVRGELRDSELVDGDEILGPITMIPIDKLIDQTEGKTVPFHYQTTRSILVSLASNPRVYGKYGRLIDTWQEQELTDEELRAIEAYPGHW